MAMSSQTSMMCFRGLKQEGIRDDTESNTAHSCVETLAIPDRQISQSQRIGTRQSLFVILQPSQAVSGGVATKIPRTQAQFS